MLPPQLTKDISTILDIAYEKLFRRALTDSPNADEQLKSQMDVLKTKLRILQTLDANHLGSQIVGAMQSPIESISKLLVDQTERDDKNFVARHDNFRRDFANTYNEFTKYWPAITAAAVDQSGLLQTEYKQFIDELKRHAEEIRTTTSEMFEQAKRSAQEITVRARETAKGVSIAEAQKQFDEARKSNRLQILVWSCVSILFTAAFGLIAFHFYYDGRSVESTEWQMVYHSLIRILILTALGAFIAFSLKMLRAHLHLYHQNTHRWRLANCITAFMDAALTPEQRDLILARLVEAVASFGTSGLLQHADDAITPQRLVFDSLVKNFTSSRTS